MEANKRIELVAITTDFTDAQVGRAAEAFLEELSNEGQCVVEMDAWREDKPMLFIVKFTCDDSDFRSRANGGELIEFVRGHFRTRDGAVAYIERTVAEVNDEKDDDETPIAQDPDDANRWTDGCESYFIETAEVLP